MRLKTLTVDNVRGIKHLDFELTGKNYAISGPNGSGKSAVIDAIDFLLTGDIARLQGRATGDVRILEHGKHIDCDEPARATVEAVLITQDGDEITVERNFGDRSNYSISDEAYREAVDELTQTAEQGLHVLTRGDILNFIFATPGERGSKVENLLRLDRVDPVRRSLNRTAERLESSEEMEESRRRTSLENLCQLVGAEGETLNVVLNRLEECRRYLGAASTTDLTDYEVDFRESLSSPVGSLPESPLRSDLTQEKLSYLTEWHDQVREELIDTLDVFLEEVDQLQNDEQSVRELRTGELIKLGIETLREEDEECPLCLTPWDYEELQERLQERKERLRSARELRNRLDSRKSKLIERLSSLAAVVGFLLEACEQEEGLDCDPICSLEGLLSELEDLLTSPVLEVSPPTEEDESLAQWFALPELARWIDEVKARIDQLTNYEPLEELRDTLRDASRLYNELGDHTRRAREFSAAATNAQTIARHFGNARRDVLDGIYDSVASTMSEYYETIHAPDESDFSVELDPKEAGLDLKVPFYDRGMHAPQALHSEGHQDTMGLCLFLALHTKLAGGSIGFTILDDVISSVDASHRRGVVDLLSRQADSLQLLLTTHDDVFLNHLRSEGVIRQKQSRRFTGWDLSIGPHDDASLSDPWHRIDSLLDNGDVPGAAARLRRTGEWFLREVAGRLRAPVPYKLDHEWSLGDFVWPLLERFSSLTKDALKAANTWGRDTTELEAFNEERKAVYRDWYSESGNVNPNVHYREDEWATFSPDELRRVVQAYRWLYELLKCSKCGSFARVILDGHTPVQVVCKCRDSFDWSLERRS